MSSMCKDAALYKQPKPNTCLIVYVLELRKNQTTLFELDIESHSRKNYKYRMESEIVIVISLNR